MSKLSNLEIVSLEDGFAVLETENGNVVEMDLEYLPDNLCVGKFLRFVVSHTDYTTDYKYETSDDIELKQHLPNGKRLTY